MKCRISIPFMLLCVCTGVVQAQAATLSALHGDVMVNSGMGFRKAGGTMKVKPGDLVLAGPESSAVLSYDDGCSAPVQADSVVAIGAQSPCALQGQTQVQGQAAIAAAGAGGGGAGGGIAGGAAAGAAGAGAGGAGAGAAAAGAAGAAAGSGFAFTPAVVGAGVAVAGAGLGAVVGVVQKLNPASP